MDFLVFVESHSRPGRKAFYVNVLWPNLTSINSFLLTELERGKAGDLLCRAGWRGKEIKFVPGSRSWRLIGWDNTSAHNPVYEKPDGSHVRVYTWHEGNRLPHNSTLFIKVEPAEPVTILEMVMASSNGGGNTLERWNPILVTDWDLDGYLPKPKGI